MRLDTTNPADIVLHSKDGTQIHFFSNLGYGGVTAMPVKVADKIEDTDGNSITITSINGFNVSTITDTLSRVVTFHYSGSVGPSSISYLDGGGTTRTISFGYTAPSCTPTFSLPAGSLDEGNCNALTSVTLPNNLHYNFTYNSTLGELSKITYPTGGYTRYDFANYRRTCRNFRHRWRPRRPLQRTFARFLRVTYAEVRLVLVRRKIPPPIP